MLIKKSSLGKFVLVCALVLLSQSVVLADTSQSLGTGGSTPLGTGGSQLLGVGTNNAVITNPLGSASTIPAFIGKLIDVFINIGTILAIFFIIYSGFLIVSAGANEEKRTHGKQAFMWTAIGIGVLFGSKVIATVLCGTINNVVEGISSIACQVTF